MFFLQQIIQLVPQQMEVPLLERVEVQSSIDDEGYSRSFPVLCGQCDASALWSDPKSCSTCEQSLKDALDFFYEFGYVVFSNVYDEDACLLTRMAMWSIIEKESPGLSRDDPQSWKQYASSGKYGLSMRGPCFHPQLVRNRCSWRLERALRAVVGSDDVMISHDRFTIYRATEISDKSLRTGIGARSISLTRR